MSNIRRGMMAAAGAGEPFDPAVTGTLWAWGYNAYGGIGDGTTTFRSSPVQIGSLDTWSVISAAKGWTMAIQSDGTLWSWGGNAHGQLGHGNQTNISSPVQIGTSKAWRQICAMDAGGGTGGTTLAVKSNGSLWAWGNAGGLPHNNETALSSPVQVGSLTDWGGQLDPAPGEYMPHPVKDDGTLWTWGYTDGRPTYGNGTVGIDVSSPVQIGTLTNWKIVTGVESMINCFGVKTDNTAWAWGINDQGALGVGNTIGYSSPVQIGTLTTWANIQSSKEGTTHATKTDGTLWGWGQNFNGYIGYGDKTNRCSPVQVGSLTDWAQGDIKMQSSTAFVAAIKTDGTIWVWGNNQGSYGSAGQLGTNNTISYSSPVQIGSDTDWLSINARADGMVAIRAA